MNDADLCIGRFPAHEFSIRRLYASDPDFRELCENYATAVSALERWSYDAIKSEDYRQIIKELEEEILDIVETQQPLDRAVS